MAIFFQPKLPDVAINSLQKAIAKAAAQPATEDPAKVFQLSRDALADVTMEGSLDWKRVGFVVGLLALVTIAGIAEYHWGSASVGERLFSWTEKIFTVLVGMIGGEATARK